MKSMHLALLALLFCTSSAWAQSSLKSGMQPGDKVAAFRVNDVTGPRKDARPLCYACAFGKHAVINIQTRRISPELMTLVKELDPLVSPASRIKGESKHGFVVLLTEEIGQAEKELTSAAAKFKIKNMPFTIFDDLAGPKSYQVAKDAEVTLMMWDKNVVKKNFAFASATLKPADIKEVVLAARLHLGLAAEPSVRAE